MFLCVCIFFYSLGLHQEKKHFNSADEWSPRDDSTRAKEQRHADMVNDKKALTKRKKQRIPGKDKEKKTIAQKHINGVGRLTRSASLILSNGHTRGQVRNGRPLDHNSRKRTRMDPNGTFDPTQTPRVYDLFCATIKKKQSVRRKELGSIEFRPLAPTTCHGVAHPCSQSMLRERPFSPIPKESGNVVYRVLVGCMNAPIRVQWREHSHTHTHAYRCTHSFTTTNRDERWTGWWSGTGRRSDLSVMLMRLDSFYQAF